MPWHSLWGDNYYGAICGFMGDLFGLMLAAALIGLAIGVTGFMAVVFYSTTFG